VALVLTSALGGWEQPEVMQTQGTGRIEAAAAGSTIEIEADRVRVAMYGMCEVVQARLGLSLAELRKVMLWLSAVLGHTFRCESYATPCHTHKP
jgi:hypothetical protein